MASFKLEITYEENSEFLLTEKMNGTMIKICTICLRRIEENEQVYINDNPNELIFATEIDISSTPKISCWLCMNTPAPIVDFDKKLDFENAIDKVKEEPLELEVIDDKLIEFNTDIPVFIEAPSCTEIFYYCYNCEYRTDDKKTLTEHMQIHSNKAKWYCDQCDYSSCNRHVLKIHSLVHTEKPFKCDHCDFRTKNKRYLKAHLDLHIQKKPRYKCIQCDYSTYRKTNLETHAHNQHSLKSYKYLQYSSKHTKLSYLKKRLKIDNDDKPLKCNKCDYTTTVKASLIKHFIEHIDNKIFKCNKCDYRTESEHSLNIHSLNKHSFGNLLECDKCSYCTNLHILLKKHTLNMHSGKEHSFRKLLKCDKCSYCTNLPTLLKKHSLKHSPEYEENLKSHLCRQHEKT